MPNDQLADLKRRLGEVVDVTSAISLLAWDQETYMPPKAATARGQQLATLSAMRHRLFTSAEMGSLLNDLTARDDLGPDDVKLVEIALYDYTRATKLPESFVHRFAQEQSRAYEVWVKARREADFNQFKPNLETLVELLREKADLLGYEGSPYNALLEEFERGMTAEELEPIFADLAEKQGELVERIVTCPNQPDTAWLDQEWDVQRQWDFTMRVLGDMGFDLEAGRQDKSVHPFTTNLDRTDVRLTTRLYPNELFSALTGSIHEGGHGLYEQGYLEQDRRTPLAEAPSLGIHESQSRMWENVIGRSLPFWRHYAPALREHFPGQLDGVSAEQIHRAVNMVRPTFIRVEADECTYNLHIVIRFEIEVAIIEGDLAVADVPEAWNVKVKEYLGLDVPDDARGCLQDIHWSHGAMGYFPTYALGNLYATQLFERILEEVPDLWDHIEAGRFAPLLDWLREHVHRHGRRNLAAQLVADATGRQPDSTAYLRYLERKYSELYRL